MLHKNYLTIIHINRLESSRQSGQFVKIIQLLFGASGVAGWSFVNEVLNDYPKKGVGSKIHALTNRPLKAEDSLWPVDERLDLVSGIDLLKGSQEELEEEMKSKIQGIEEVTHVYYLAYKASLDEEQEIRDAFSMFSRAITAVDHLSPVLSFVVLQTGAKMYGIHLQAESHAENPVPYLQVPHAESQLRLKAPFYDTIFYHHQLDWIAEYAASKSWSWCDTRPDFIIGFVPNQNAYSISTVIAIFLSLFREVEGKGAKCSYPGTEKAFRALSNEGSGDIIARQSIFLSLSDSTKKGDGYNVADAREPQSWAHIWPLLCAYFGLEGVPPKKEPLEVRKYINFHINVWNKLEDKHGLKKGIAHSDIAIPGFEYYLLTMFDFDRQCDLSKIYNMGFEEERTTMESWRGVIDRMRAAKIIPEQLVVYDIIG